MEDTAYVNLIPPAKNASLSGEENPHTAGIICNEASFSRAAYYFTENIKKVLSLKSTDEKGISLIKDEKLQEEEYVIHSDKSSLTLKASCLKGINRGLSALLQLSRPLDEAHFLFPDGEIQDFPDKKHRGLMIDNARFFHTVGEILDAVDLCWMYRMSVLHIHFCDDQSYTLPSDLLPLLPTENRHYTKKEIKEITEYAYERGITILPEIEMPGHCKILQQTYPEIFGSCGILRASEKTFEYLDGLIRETAELFPYSEMIHIGSDEAATEKWAGDKETGEYMKKEGIKDFRELYNGYVARCVKSVIDKGRTPAVWEGFPESGNGKIDKRCVVFVFESYYQTAPGLIEAGFRVVNASWKPMYVVPPLTYWSPAEISRWNIYTWMNWWPCSKAYYNDIKVAPTDFVTGGQMCVWGDNMMNFRSRAAAIKNEFYLIKERISYVSERLWNGDTEAPPAVIPSTEEIYEKAELLLR